MSIQSTIFKGLNSYLERTKQKDYIDLYTRQLIIFKFIIFSAFLTFSSCNQLLHPCSFELSPAEIQGNCSMYNGLVIKELRNVTKIENNIPVEYEVVYKVTYGPKSPEYLIVDNKKLKKIIFNNEIEGYHWILHGQGIVSPTIPITFKENTWYIFGRLYEHGAPSVLLFAYLNEDDSFIVYRKDTPTNW